MSDELSLKGAVKVAENLTKHHQAFAKLAEVLQYAQNVEKTLKDSERALEKLQQDKQGQRAQLENLQKNFKGLKAKFDDEIKEKRAEHKEEMKKMSSERATALRSIQVELDRARIATQEAIDAEKAKLTELRKETAEQSRHLRDLNSQISLLKDKLKGV